MSHTATTDNLFSCDLVAAAKHHLAFLRRLHALGVTLSAVSPAMVDRYLNKWLPLVAASVAGTEEGTVDNEHDHQQLFVQQPPLLIPPPDVSWLWHCHRLAPSCYRTYTQREFGRVLEAHPSFAFQEQQQDANQVEESTSSSVATTPDGNDSLERAKQDTIAAWEKAYPDEPFFLSTADDNTVTSNDEETKEPSNHRHPKQRPCVVCQLDGFDLIASTLCQALFLWQVSGPRFTDDAFLRDGVERYYKFLRLQHFENESSSSSSLPIVPTYQIDLMWHTHILVSCHGYRNDCLRIRGREFHHDDSLNDRSPGAKLERAFAATVQLWNEAYKTDNNKNNSDYIVPGGMYRGEPPSAFYDTETWSRQLNGYDAGDQLTVPASTTTTTTAAPITLMGASSSGRNVTTTSSVAIWEFEGDKGWKSYSSVHQQLLEQAYQCCTTSTAAAAAAPTASSSGTTTTPGVVQVKSGTHTYEVNVQAMTQTNVERPCRKQRNVRRRLGNAPPVWEWQDDDNNAWIEYGGVHQQQIEDAYQRLSQPPPTGKVQFQIGQQMFYEADVNTMIQTSIEHGTRRQRNIRRSYGPPAPWQIPTTGLHFHPARPKSQTRNVNSNEKKDGFVFGRGTAGDGYYSLETQDAYRIMRLRLATRARYAQAQVDGYDCSHCLCWGCTRTRKERLALENKCSELRYMSAYMKAKSRAAGPAVEPDRKTIESYLVPAGRTTTTDAAAARTTTTGNRTSDTSTGGDFHGSPVPYYWYTGYYCYSAAGCGGGDGGCGAGCGGGACGGGGCGGGCGGGAFVGAFVGGVGGCGGGGCGGGGC